VRNVNLLSSATLITTELYILYNYKVRYINYSLGMLSPFTSGDDSSSTNSLKGE